MSQSSVLGKVVFLGCAPDVFSAYWAFAPPCIEFRATPSRSIVDVPRLAVQYTVFEGPGITRDTSSGYTTAWKSNRADQFACTSRTKPLPMLLHESHTGQLGHVVRLKEHPDPSLFCWTSQEVSQE